MEDIRKELHKLLSVNDNQNKSNKKIIFDHYFNHVSKLPPSELEKIFSSPEHHHRIEAVKENFKWIPLDPTIINKYQKNKDISSTLRNMGNNAFKEKKWMSAVRLYNLAILFAHPGEPELGIAYANRSTSLNYMDLTEEALKDIDLALANGYPSDSNMLKKMDVKRRKFEEQLAERAKNQSFEKKLQDELSKINAFYSDMFTLKAPNPLAPVLENSVDIKYSAECGRHLVANTDIPIGTTVLVERPFVAVLCEALNWEVDHCHHCFKTNFQCIPCPHCVFTLYCDEKCLKQAQEYHQYECPCLPGLHCNLKDYVGENFQLAFKLICKMGPNTLYDMFIKKKENKCDWQCESENEILAGADPTTGIYEPDSYRAIYNLYTYVNPNQAQQYLLYSLILSYTLASDSHFFNGIQDNAQKEEFKDFVAELIAHHYETFRRNGFGLGEIEDMEGATLRTVMKSDSKIQVNYGLDKIVSGVFTTASLINHSCDQNVMRFAGNTFGTMTFVASKSLKKGQELLTSYCAEYGTLNKEEETTEKRREVLNRVYGFHCNCIACNNDWPSIEELAVSEPIFCCPSCSLKFPHESKTSPEFLKCKLTKNFKCRSCNIEHNALDFHKKYDFHRNQLKTCHDLIDMNRPLDAVDILKHALLFFETYVCPPNYFSIIFGPVIYRDVIHHVIFFADRE